jgi:hypothetical protein
MWHVYLKIVETQFLWKLWQPKYYFLERTKPKGGVHTLENKYSSGQFVCQVKCSRELRKRFTTAAWNLWICLTLSHLALLRQHNQLEITSSYHRSPTVRKSVEPGHANIDLLVNIMAIDSSPLFDLEVQSSLLMQILFQGNKGFVALWQLPSFPPSHVLILVIQSSSWQVYIYS